jgi:hypothetical protein
MIVRCILVLLLSGLESLTLKAALTETTNISEQEHWNNASIHYDVQYSENSVAIFCLWRSTRDGNAVTGAGHQWPSCAYSISTPWRHIGDWWHICAHFQPLYQMEVQGQVHAPADLPQRKLVSAARACEDAAEKRLSPAPAFNWTSVPRVLVTIMRQTRICDASFFEMVCLKEVFWYLFEIQSKIMEII